MPFTEQALGPAGVGGRPFGALVDVPQCLQPLGLRPLGPGLPQPLGRRGNSGVDFGELFDQPPGPLAGAAALTHVEGQRSQLEPEVFQAELKSPALLGNPRRLD